MTEHLEWDFDNPAHRRPRLERARIEITIQRRQRPNLLPVFIAIVAVLVLWRFKLGMLMLAALVGWQFIGTALFVGTILAVLSWRERLTPQRCCCCLPAGHMPISAQQ
jgi:hypothetical protein